MEKVQRKGDDDIVTIEVTREWLEVFRKAVYWTPDGRWLRVGWTEPLVDSGRIRIMSVPIEAQFAVPQQANSNMFSRN